MPTPKANRVRIIQRHSKEAHMFSPVKYAGSKTAATYGHGHLTPSDPSQQLDFRNASNAVSRDHFLRSVESRVPKVYGSVNQPYG